MPTFIATRSETYLASMPNLTFTGLSENWLLKECGHQQWLALTQLHDRPLPNFADEQGRIAYASFTAVKTWNLKLEAIIENRAFQIQTRFGAVGRPGITANIKLGLAPSRGGNWRCCPRS
ncbi:putative biosynthetic protein (TIGR04098 family) [Pseudomonas tolaasii]